MKLMINYRKLRRQQRYLNDFSKINIHASYRSNLSSFLLYNRNGMQPVKDVIQLLETNIHKHHMSKLQTQMNHTRSNNIKISNEILPNGITIDLCNNELIFTKQESV